MTFQPPVVIFQPPTMGTASPPANGPARRRKEPAEAAAPAADASDAGGESQSQASGDHEDDGESGTRRRRRGGRGHGKTRNAADEALEAPVPSADQQAESSSDAANGGRDQAADGDEQGDEGSGTGPRRRRRRRRSGSGGDGGGGDVTPDDPPNTVVHVRAPRAAAAATPTDISDVRGVRGSTRLEAKRQRRRDGRETGRRRPPIITESEFLARREAVERVMVVRQRGDRTQIAVLEDGVLVEHYVDKASHQSYVGNVYLGKVQNVLPSMEAAFVDIGKGRNAVLYAGEVNFDASGLEGESKRIESALKSGQSILVQVTKDPIAHKGARLTSQVSLPGRYLVYVPGASMTGISRKLPDTERTRLKKILKQVMPEGAGVIVRTAAEGASEEELARDVSRLAAQWEAIERRVKTASSPDLLYSEPDLTIRVVRDIFNEDFGKLVIASDGEWDIVDEYVRYVAPHLAERLERWQDDEGDVFAAYRIDEQLAKALERKVWLPSGGSLVIDNTEAMTVIDVNTGKFTGQGGNLEQTVTRNNLEAAEEIVRQLRLRDVGGIIVIDFIDMVLESNRDLVLRRLMECLARDRTKHQVAEVTSLGLVQMTRKRVGAGLLEAFSVTCEHCNGRGVIVSLEPVDHTLPHGRDDDGRGKDDGKSRGGRGSRGGKQPKGDGSRGGGRNGNGTSAEGSSRSDDLSSRDGSAQADNSGSSGRAGQDDAGSDDGAGRAGGTAHVPGTAYVDSVEHVESTGYLGSAAQASTAQASTAQVGTAQVGTAQVSQGVGGEHGDSSQPAGGTGPDDAAPAASTAGTKRAGRSRGRVVRSAGPAAPANVTPDSPGAVDGSAVQGSAVQGSPAADSPAPGQPVRDNGAGPVAGAGPSDGVRPGASTPPAASTAPASSTAPEGSTSTAQADGAAQPGSTGQADGAAQADGEPAEPATAAGNRRRRRPRQAPASGDGGASPVTEQDAGTTAPVV